MPFSEARFTEALADWKDAAELYGRERNVRQQSRALLQAAQAAQALGHIHPALQYLELALSLAHEVGDPVWLAMVLENL